MPPEKISRTCLGDENRVHEGEMRADSVLQLKLGWVESWRGRNVKPTQVNSARQSRHPKPTRATPSAYHVYMWDIK